MAERQIYCIWFRQHHSSAPWRCTSHCVKARTDKEAESLMTRSFQNCGFSSMSMTALPQGVDPNELVLRRLSETNL